MAAAIIYSLSPVKLNSTVLPAANFTFSTAIASQAFRHSGNLYPSVMTVAGAQPMVTFKTTFAEAYGLIGIGNGPLKLTTFEIYLAKFTDAVRQTGGTSVKFGLNTSCTGYAYITGASTDQNGILMADVSVAVISNDGMAHPILRTNSVSIPTLASEPTLYSLGPVTVNGTTIAGVASAGFQTGFHTELLATDGDLYPRVFACYGGDRSLSIEFKDPPTAWTTIGFIGVNVSSNVIQYFRGYDATTQQKLTTGYSLTIASGRIMPDSLSSDNLAVSNAPARVVPLSASTTDPFIFASGVSIPTP